jgi:hypothetical protein
MVCWLKEAMDGGAIFFVDNNVNKAVVILPVVLRFAMEEASSIFPAERRQRTME